MINRVARSAAPVLGRASRAVVLGASAQARELVRGFRSSAESCDMKADLERAKAAVNSLSAAPPDNIKLKLYAFFKQATEGDNTTPQPGMFEFVRRAMWGEWASLKGMTRDEAATRYIEMAKVAGADISANASVKPSPATATTTVTASGAAAKASDAATCLVSVADGVMTVTMNRPSKRNAISWAMYKEIGDALEEATRSDSVRVVVLTGAGDYYSAGNDLTNFLQNMPPEGPKKLAADASVMLEAFVNRFIDFPKTLMAAVNGPAVGIPVTTLGLVDFAIASHTATFETPFTKLGLSPEACSSLTFPEIMGPIRANAMLIGGKKLLATEARDYGLINEVVESSLFRGVVTAEAKRLAALPKNSMRLSKAMIRTPERRELLRSVNKAECDTLEERWISDECLAAVTEFMTRKA